MLRFHDDVVYVSCVDSGSSFFVSLRNNHIALSVIRSCRFLQSVRTRVYGLRKIIVSEFRTSRDVLAGFMVLLITVWHRSRNTFRMERRACASTVFRSTVCVYSCSHQRTYRVDRVVELITRTSYAYR